MKKYIFNSNEYNAINESLSENRTIVEAFLKVGPIRMRDGSVHAPNEFVDVVNAALTKFEQKHPWEYNFIKYARILYLLNGKVTRTMCVDDRGDLYINVEFIYSFLKMNSNYIMYILYHEAMHNILNHVQRGIAYGKKHGKLTWTEMNICADFEVNGQMVSDHVCTANDWSILHGCYDQQFKGLTFEMIADRKNKISNIDTELEWDPIIGNKNSTSTGKTGSKKWTDGKNEMKKAIDDLVKHFGGDKKKTLDELKKLYKKTKDPKTMLSEIKNMSTQPVVNFILNSRLFESENMDEETIAGLKDGFKDSISDLINDLRNSSGEQTSSNDLRDEISEKIDELLKKLTEDINDENQESNDENQESDNKDNKEDSDSIDNLIKELQDSIENAKKENEDESLDSELDDLLEKLKELEENLKDDDSDIDDLQSELEKISDEMKDKKEESNEDNEELSDEDLEELSKMFDNDIDVLPPGGNLDEDGVDSDKKSGIANNEEVEEHEVETSINEGNSIVGRIVKHSEIEENLKDSLEESGYDTDDIDAIYDEIMSRTPTSQTEMTELRDLIITNKKNSTLADLCNKVNVDENTVDELWEELVKKFLERNTTRRGSDHRKEDPRDIRWGNKRYLSMDDIIMPYHGKTDAAPQYINIFIDCSGSIDVGICLYFIDFIEKLCGKLEFSGLRLIPFSDVVDDKHIVSCTGEELKEEKNIRVLKDFIYDCESQAFGGGGNSSSFGSIAKFIAKSDVSEPENVYLVMGDGGYFDTYNVMKFKPFSERVLFCVADRDIKNTLKNRGSYLSWCVNPKNKFLEIVYICLDEINK